MWELDCEESWELKNWCFWTVVLEKTLESPLDCMKIQPVHSEGDQSWVFFGRNDAKAETPVLWSPHVKSWLIGKDSDAERDGGQKEKGTTEDKMARWHHRLNWREFEWTPWVCDGQGGLAYWDSWGHKESDMTEWLNWTELKFLRNLYVGQEATVRTRHGTTDWFQIGKGVHQGCILSPCLFYSFAEYIMQNAGLDEAQAEIKIAWRNSNELLDESEKREWKSWLKTQYSRVSFPSGFLSVYAQQWGCWIIRQFYFQFFKESPHCSP